MRVLYLDPFSGVSGDMLLGALFDLGASRRSVEAGLKRLRLPPWRWTVERVRRGEFAGLRVEVRAGSRAARRGLLAAVLRRAPSAGLPAGVGNRGRRVVSRLLAAEGAVHGRPPAHVHLHEVEDLDTVVDVFGSLLALHDLGVQRVYAAPVVVGTGTVRAAHGELPVPAPGTAELLRGRDVRFGVGTGELATPTGAALVAELAEPAPPPVIRVERVGYGAGGRDTAPRPNLLRAFLGSVSLAAGAEELAQLETVVDDMSPQLVEAFLARAYREGALEAWVASVQMKRSRPGIALVALARPDRIDALLGAYFEETGTLGVRVFRVDRVRLERRMTSVRTRWGKVRVKVAGVGPALHAIPEWRDVLRLAERGKVPARLVLEEARALAAKAGRPHR